MIDLRLGNVLSALREMPDKSVHCIVTSPPYWGLRAYGTQPQVWLNGHEPCQVHQWGDFIKISNRKHDSGTDDGSTDRQRGEQQGRSAERGNTCLVCGAWRGELGLEPTPELYVEHLVQVFREVRRVLRDDGTLWLNLGDSYWGGKGQSSQAWSTEHADRATLEKSQHQITGKGETRPQDGKHPIIKPKDLVGIPWRVAFALQADGWYLRSDIIWHKPNPMPESVTDRPTKAHEYIFLMAKSQKYYYDAEAIKETQQGDGRKRGCVVSDRKAEHVPHQAHYGVQDTGYRNRRSVWTVPTQPYKGAHFATFPEKLIEPCILAGSKVGDTILDPFCGSGTTGAVATRHRRNFIGVDLKQEYLDMAQDRIAKEQM